MFVAIPYTVYRWTPPELSLPEKIWLGGEIAKVGRKAFATALKQRLSTPARGSNNKPFTFADVLGDAEKLGNGNRAQSTPPTGAVIAALLFFGGCFWVIATNRRLLVAFLVAILVIGPVSIGSLLWMHNKVDRWAQSLIDEYTHTIANEKLSKKEALFTSLERAGGRLAAEAALSSPARIFEQSAVANGPPRGRMTFSTGLHPTIELFEPADASTFINLVGHQCLEELIRDAKHELAPDQLKADAQTVLKWLGVEKVGDIKTLQHDKFARGFETYIMEGRAPSRQLASVLVKQKEALTKIYRTRQLLNTPINDDLRGVFDRLLATPEQIAAAVADTDGQFNLGRLYEQGRGGLRKDDCEAARLYKLAADQGHAWAQFNLANFYEQGRGGLRKDDREAARLYKLAADQGHAWAQGNLGHFYAQGRGGLPPDDREAARRYKLAADQGHAWAQGNLGVYYEQGRGGLPKDDREAARLYKLAADQGDARRQCNLGVFYSEGRGGLPKDDCEAARLFKLAADQGDAFAQVNLGVFYEQGRGGLPKDDREAARLYKLAADQGDARGQAALTRRGRQQQRQERQREAAAREHQSRHAEQDRQRQEEQQRQRESAARERQSSQKEQDRRRDTASGKMSIAQALEILGLKAGATNHDIRAAYNRLMKLVHPDVGGSNYFAKHLNEARDVLLGQWAR